MNDAAAAEDERLRIREISQIDFRNQMTADIRAGLTADPKWFLPKYLYDDLGSELFEAICLLPEYYLTRAENEILETYADEIVAELESAVVLLELGSGAATKTRNLIEALLRRQAQLEFIPIDISASALEESSSVLLQAYPELSISAYAGDYFSGLETLAGETFEGQILAIFLGSNIGNFEPSEALKFLRAVRGVLRPGGCLLLGADLRKDRRVLELAYDDPLGVTSAFNLNLLQRLNREFNADFKVRGFRHVAHYNEEAGRVEIHMESRVRQTVVIKDLELTVQFAEGERIHSENSHKYDLESLSAMAATTGFKVIRTWYDAAKMFSSNLFVAV